MKEMVLTDCLVWFLEAFVPEMVEVLRVFFPGRYQNFLKCLSGLSLVDSSSCV